MYSFARILNCDILRIRQSVLLNDLRKGVLITPNLDHLCKLQKDKEFYDLYHGKSLAYKDHANKDLVTGENLPYASKETLSQPALWIICDSVILYFFSKLLFNKSLPEAIPGSSFFTEYYKFHRNDPNCRIFLLGAKEGVAKKAMLLINQKVGRNIIVGAHSPSFGFEKKPEEIENIIQIIKQSEATVVLVGVGAPKQEKFIMTYRERMPNVELWMALGATIDFEAETLSRAPRWINKCGLEWAYRIYQEPRRMFKRYFGDDLVFFWHYFLQFIHLYKDPFSDNNQK